LQTGDVLEMVGLAPVSVRIGLNVDVLDVDIVDQLTTKHS